MQFVARELPRTGADFVNLVNLKRMAVNTRYKHSPLILELLAGLFRGILRFLVCVLGRLMRFKRILHGLLGVFVSGQVIFFSVVHRGSAMCVRGLFVKFSGALMRIVWHDDPLWHRSSTG
jgi:hypothetical protein